jgi:hypothetical protein
LGTLAGSVLLTGLALYRHRLPQLRRLDETKTRLTHWLDTLQSGIVNDYVTWLLFGLACLGGGLAYGLR